MMTAIRSGFLRFFATLLALLLTSSLAAADYIINYEIVNHEGGTNISATENSLFLTDTFDQYTEVPWEILSAERQEDGSVQLQVQVEMGTSDSYLSTTYIEFEILSSNGSLDAEPVIVDAWAAVQLNYDLAAQYPMNSVCCVSELFILADSIGSASAGIYPGPIIEANLGDGYATSSLGDTFFGPYELFTNTTYALSSRADLYVEVLIDSLPTVWDENEYDSFVEKFGLSGTAYHKVDGFLQFGMVVHSVPEPGALALFFAGIVALSLMRRRPFAAQAK